MSKQCRAGEVQIDDAELTKIVKRTGAPKAAVIKALKRARKSGHRAVAVALDKPAKNLTSEPQLTPKQQKLQAKADRELLQKLVARYGPEQLIRFVRKKTPPRQKAPPRRRGPKSPFAASVTKSLLEEVQRDRQAGSKHPLKDVYKAIFVDEIQSAKHYENWKRELRRKRSKLGRVLINA